MHSHLAEVEAGVIFLEVLVVRGLVEAGLNRCVV